MFVFEYTHILREYVVSYGVALMTCFEQLLLYTSMLCIEGINIFILRFLAAVVKICEHG